MHGELTKQQTENILLSQSVCRIACIDGKFPYIVPLNYFYDGKYIYAQSQEGKKIKALRKNPKVRNRKKPEHYYSTVFLHL